MRMHSTYDGVAKEKEKIGFERFEATIVEGAKFLLNDRQIDRLENHFVVEWKRFLVGTLFQSVRRTNVARPAFEIE